MDYKKEYNKALNAIEKIENACNSIRDADDFYNEIVSIIKRYKK